MSRNLEPYKLIERSIIKKFRKSIWNPFILAVKRYELVKEGDRIAVCISGGKDSMRSSCRSCIATAMFYLSLSFW